MADDPQYAGKRESLKSFLPKTEAPLVREGISLWNIVDADKPDLSKTKKNFKSVNKLRPSLQ